MHFLDFCTLSCQHHKWMTQLDSIEKHNHSNHQNPKIIYTKSFYMFYMFMITVKIIFTVFWLFLLTFEGYFVQQNCNSRTAKLLTPSRQMFRFDYLTSRLNIYISGKITTFSRCSKSIKTKHAENYLIFKLIYIKLYNWLVNLYTIFCPTLLKVFYFEKE